MKLMDYSFVTLARRAKLRIHNRIQAKKLVKLMVTMSSTQRKTFDGVVKTIKAHPETIHYDKITAETLILFKQENVIIVLKNNTVSTYNHIKFGPPVWFTNEQYKYLMDSIDVEAHRYRRRLKWEITDNTNKFLDEVFKNKTI